MKDSAPQKGRPRKGRNEPLIAYVPPRIKREVEGRAARDNRSVSNWLAIWLEGLIEAEAKESA